MYTRVARAGLMSGLGPVYYSEVLPAHAVGRALLANTVTLQLGSLVAAIGGLEFVFATSSLWIYIFGEWALLAAAEGLKQKK